MAKFLFWWIVFLCMVMGGIGMNDRLEQSNASNIALLPAECGITISSIEKQKEEFADLLIAAKGRKISTHETDTLYLRPEYQVRYIVDDIVIGIVSEQKVIFDKYATVEFGSDKNGEEMFTKISTQNGKFRIECPDGSVIEYDTREMGREYDEEEIKKRADEIFSKPAKAK